MWRSSRALKEELLASAPTPALHDLYALRTFFGGCIYSEGYTANEEWASILQFTEAGKKAISVLEPELKKIPKADFHLAFFIKFFHHDLFIDVNGTDVEKIKSILNQELLQERIRLPFRFGRLLYDRYNDTYPNLSHAC